MAKIQVKINKPFGAYTQGSKVTIDVDVRGKPIAQQWRKRLADASIDQCCEIVYEQKTMSSKKVKITNKKVGG